MAKLSAPLLSFGARGTIAKTQTYGTWKGIKYARQHVIPANPNTSAQQETRGAFKLLQEIFKFAVAPVPAVYLAAVEGRPMTARNLFTKQNLANIRGDANLNNLSFSPGARAGIVAAGMSITAGSEQLTVELEAPALPPEWTITQAWAIAIADGDPETLQVYNSFAAFDNSAPYAPVLENLEAAQIYQVSGFFEFLRPDGKTAYGPALTAQGTPTA